MKQIPFLLILLLAYTSCISHKTTLETRQITQKNTKDTFPVSWYGKWRGTIVIYNNQGKVQEIPMEICIASTDSMNRHKMSLIYGVGEKQDVRDYEIIEVDSSIGHFKTDEKNRIYLDSYYFDGILYSRFEVMSNLLLTRIEKRHNKLYFEVISGSSEPISTTGDNEDNNIPPVNSYNIKISQRAELQKYE